jgi:hypothetical protein
MIRALPRIALGVRLDTFHGTGFHPQEDAVKKNWTDPMPNRPVTHQRAERHSVELPARLTWRDQRGTTRFASVVARNVSEFGVYVECQSAVSIPMYRLVQFQLEREGREGDMLPDALRRGRVLSAVYRVSPASAKGAPQGLALRLMVEPHRRVAVEHTPARATA